MSEYQYYEFLAIDRPLTAAEMRVLRSYSTRAVITPTSFTNHYNWGDFKGNPDKWVEKYFDAFLYLANWGTHILKLRFPSELLSLETAREYCQTDFVSAWEKDGKLIVSFESQDEDGDWEEDGVGLLSSMVSVRSEIIDGDLRALYLGWLLDAQNEELEEDDLEPPVPPNLKELSPSLESLANFLRIDAHLLAAAASASPTVEKPKEDNKAFDKWIATLDAREKDAMLASLMRGEADYLGRELLTRFQRETHPASSGVSAADAAPRRTVSQLLAGADEFRRIAEKHKAEAKARRERAAAEARNRYLDDLAGRTPQTWAEIESLIATKLPKNYDEAMKLLKDLKDLADRQGSSDFQLRIAALRAAHARKSALMDRLRKLGL